jgi:glutamate--cysteine ligase
MLTTQRLTGADVSRMVRQSFTDPRAPAASPGYVGVEVEWIPARPEVSPPAPVAVAQSSALIGAAADIAGQGQVTYEPGGQVEMSPAPSVSVADLIVNLDVLEARLRASLQPGGVELFSSGVNPWHALDELGLQTPGPRYSAMQAHFDTVDTAGRRMMRQTAALQVCLDIGGPATWFDRWRLANLAGPALSAAFANSPILERAATGMPGTRSSIWQRVDPSRTGFDGMQVGGNAAEASEAYLKFVLDAVYIPRSDTITDAASMPQGTIFGDLVAAGDAPLRESDAAYHLSTLFPPVRPRRHLEVRYLDALPTRWRAVAIGLLATLLYEPRATSEALESLDGSDLDVAAWDRAATRAMHDASLRSTALALFDIALRGVPRLPAGYLPADMVEHMSEYRERFPADRRSPADEQLERFIAAPEDLSTWR